MHIYRYTHSLESTMVTKYRANRPVTTAKLLIIRFHTLHCTLRHEVLLMQNISRGLIEKCNALRKEMHVCETYQSHHQGRVRIYTLLLLNYENKLYFVWKLNNISYKTDGLRNINIQNKDGSQSSALCLTVCAKKN